MTSPSKIRKLRKQRKIIFPNRVSCTKTQYMSRFPKLTEKIRKEVMKDLDKEEDYYHIVIDVNKLSNKKTNEIIELIEKKYPKLEVWVEHD